MSCEFGSRVRVTLFGQSHGEAVGAVLDGLPAGEAIDLDQAQAFLRRRAPGQAHATARVESDIPHVLSGLTDGHTCGAPLCAVIENHGANSRDYDALRDIPRPMHADYPARVKFHGQADLRGGGVYSARLTAALCFALSVMPMPEPAVTWTQLSVGSADAAVLRNGGEVWAVDAGEGDDLAVYLRQQRVSLTGLVLTHLHSDHAGGVRYLLESGIPVERCYLPWGAELSAAVPSVAEVLATVTVSTLSLREAEALRRHTPGALSSVSTWLGTSSPS